MLQVGLFTTNTTLQEGPGGQRKVNQLFRADFFGERALLGDEPRTATVEAVTQVTCLTLDRWGRLRVGG